jgi:hypothetical protein
MSFRKRPSLLDSRARMFAAAAALLTALVAAAPAEAGARGRAPWCGNLSGHSLDDCNYFTFEQCLVSVHGLGGICSRNPGALAYAPHEPRRKKYRRAYK